MVTTIKHPIPFILLNPFGSGFNGYVAIPKSHALYRKTTHDDRVSNLKVHGDITFSGFGKELGFDTLHHYSGDMTKEKVVLETIRLFQQLCVPEFWGGDATEIHNS